MTLYSIWNDEMPVSEEEFEVLGDCPIGLCYIL